MLRVHPGCFRWCCWVLLGNCRLFNDLCSFGERNIPHLARGSGAEHCWCYHHTSFHWSVESSLYSILWDTRINKLRIQDVVIIPVRLGGFLEMLSSFWVLQEEIVKLPCKTSCLLSTEREASWPELEVRKGRLLKEVNLNLGTVRKIWIICDYTGTYNFFFLSCKN